MSSPETCNWRLSSPYSYVREAPQCGDFANLRVIRETRKTDLFLCLHHGRDYQRIYGTVLPVEVLA